MDVFVGNLSTLAVANVLAFQSKWNFKAQEKVIGPDEQGRVNRYLLARSGHSGEKHAKQLIRRLDGSRHKGCKIEAREHVRRVIMNERRAQDWRSKPWHKEERRIVERRIGQRSEPSSINL